LLNISCFEINDECETIHDTFPLPKEKILNFLGKTFLLSLVIIVVYAVLAYLPLLLILLFDWIGSWKLWGYCAGPLTNIFSWDKKRKGKARDIELLPRGTEIQGPIVSQDPP
jgi:hypothetical protein